MPRFPLRTLIIVILLASPAFAEPTQDDAINDLVGQLVSPNKRPEVRNALVRYPKGFDKESQKAVHRAWNQLYDLGLDAFPTLIESLDDNRYCLTEMSRYGGGDHNYSVGRACRKILKSHLQPYGGVGYDPKRQGPPAPKRPDYFRHFELHYAQEFRDWFAARRGKSLRELQLEVLEWTVAEEARNPTEYTDQERKYLSDLLEKMKENRRTLKPGYPFQR